MERRMPKGSRKPTGTVTDEDIAKLPKWAQEHIDNLKGQIAYWSTRAIDEEPQESNVHVRELVNRSNRALEKDSVISFTLDNGREIYCYLDHQYECLAVNGVGGRASGVDARVSIEPRASNCFFVR